MKKFNLYAVVLCSTLLCAPGVQAINEGGGGGRDAKMEIGRGSSSTGNDPMRGEITQIIEICDDCEGEWEGSWEGSHSGSSEADSPSEREAGTRGIEGDPVMRQSTGNEERASNRAVAGDRAAGANAGTSLGHHSDAFEADGHVGPISHTRDH